MEKAFYKIDPTLAHVFQLWEENFPDWRFMQFIVNLQTWMRSDGFYLEDEALLERVYEFVEESKVFR